MRSTLLMVVVGVGLLLPVPVARVSAHHSFAAEYDANKPVTLTGTVTTVEWINPHGWIHLDVKDQSGKVTNWAIETGTPGLLAKRGLKRTFLPVGAEVVITGYQAKDGTSTANGATVKFPDGRDIFLGSSAGDAPSREDGGPKPPTR